MKLSIRDRLYLLMKLPPEGDLTTLRIVSDLKRSLSFTDDELTDYGIVTKTDDHGRVSTSWDHENDTGVEITIGPKALEIITGPFKKDDKDGKLQIDHLDLYERLLAEADSQTNVKKMTPAGGV